MGNFKNDINQNIGNKGIPIPFSTLVDFNDIVQNFYKNYLTI